MSNKLSLYTLETVHHEELLWNSVYPKLQKYCHFLSQSKWDGDDLAQEAMLKAITYYSPEKISLALLNKIAHNQWMDTLRKRKKEELRNDQQHENTYTRMGDAMCSVEMLMEYFTPRQAIIFILKEAFQYQSKEIAEILNTTEMAVKSSINRAKKRIENQSEPNSLEFYWEEEDREQFWNLFHDSLVNQDPTHLIEAIPSIIDITEAPTAVTRNTIAFKVSSPLSTLCMAA
jgi:RNA polymerase sigma factor (sigma-70 family)